MKLPELEIDWDAAEKNHATLLKLACPSCGAESPCEQPLSCPNFGNGTATNKNNNDEALPPPPTVDVSAADA